MAKRRIVPDDLYRLVTLDDPRLSPDERWIAVVATTQERLENRAARHVWLIPTDPRDGEPYRLTTGGSDFSPRWSPDGAWLAFVSARSGKPQIYRLRVTAPGGEPTALTAQPNGATAPAWSPDGRQIAFLSPLDADERAREASGEHPPKPTDALTAAAERARAEDAERRRRDPLRATRIPYRDGFAVKSVYFDGRCPQVYVMDAQPNAAPRRLTDADAMHGDPSWSPDGAYVYTDRPFPEDADEFWRALAVIRICLADGAQERLTGDIYAVRGAQAHGGRVAAIATPRYRLYTRSSVLVQLDPAGETLAAPSFDRAVVEFRWSADELIFRAHSSGATNLYRVPVIGRDAQPVTTDVQEISGFDVGAGIAYTALQPLSASEVYYQTRGAAPRQRTTFHRAWLDEVTIQPAQEIRFTAPTGAVIQGWYIAPSGWQAGDAPPPLTLHIHGGPRIMWGPAYRGAWFDWQAFAAHGYAVAFCNPRGSDGYGETFQAHSFGEPDFPEQMAFIDHLVAQGLADAARLGVTGGSYGGYMTTWIISHTDRFKAAVAERGVYNLLSQYGTSDVPSLTTDEFGIEPWQDAGTLWARSPLAHAHKIKTPLLLIHGEEDYRVSVSESEQMFSYVKRSGGTVELLRQPRETHEHARAGEPEHRIQRLHAMFEWFDRYLR